MPDDWDLIVVGAGSAGAVIAARVTEDARRRVLLIEAGPDYTDAVPEDLRDGRKNSVVAHDWGFIYQPNASSRPDVPLPRGKVTGGSSSVNTCIALRGQPGDYSEWAAVAGPEWAWERCLPAFIRLESDADVRNELHGADGPILIRRHLREELVPFQAAFLDACVALGYPACPDHNDPRTTGHGPHPMNKTKDGVRVGTLLGYLAPARGRPNLTIRPRTIVRRVVIANGRATGLEVETDGAMETVSGKRIVLCAGSIQSPAILVRSGIGPRETLERLGVAAVRDAQGVGARLYDHPGTLVVLIPKPGVSGFEQPLIQTTLRYTAAGSDDENDMQLEPISFIQRMDGGLPMTGLAPVVEKTRGHGRLEFESADPRAQPRIVSDFLRDDWDAERMLEGLELALRVAAQPAVAALTERIYRPRPEVIADREELRAWARRAAGSGYHPCATAPMGAPDDPLAVVDQYGRVFGVEGLYVADASIMPTVPRANINIPTIMIGERFGEWFREDAI